MFSNGSEDYLGSFSVVRPLSVLPSDTAHKAPFRNHQKLEVITRNWKESPETADNQKRCRFLFSHPPDTPLLKDYQDLLCFHLKWELVWNSSQKRMFSPELFKFKEEAVKTLLACPQTQNSSCFDYFLLVIKLLASLYMGSLGVFSATWGTLLAVVQILVVTGFVIQICLI